MLHKKVKSSSQNEPDGVINTSLQSARANSNCRLAMNFPENEMLPRPPITWFTMNSCSMGILA